MFWVLFGCDQQQIGVLCIFRMGEIISVHKETGKGAAVTSYWKNGGQSILTGSGEILTRFEDGNYVKVDPESMHAIEVRKAVLKKYPELKRRFDH